MLEKVVLHNYRCFENSEISFRNTAIVVGNNNAGKSSLVEALRLVADAAQRYRKANYASIPEVFGLPVSVRGFKLNVENLKIDLRTVVYQYRENVYAEIKAFFHEKVCIRVLLRDGVAYAVVEKDGVPISTRTQAGRMPDLQLYVMHQLALIREDENPLAADTVKKDLNSRLSSLHFRNELLLYRDHFETFRTLAHDTWPGLRIEDLDHPFGEKISLLVRDEDYTAEIGMMGSGLQMWLQIVWFVSRCPETATIVLDEPDVYMHPDLQRKILRIVQNRFDQVIIATHSVEIISGVEPREIVTVDKRSRKMRYANSYRAVQDVISNLGSAHNLSLVRLGNAKKCVFVEGKDVKLLTKLQNRLYPRASMAIDQLPSVPLGGWSRFDEALGAARLFYDETQGEIQTYCILDRDNHTDDEVAELHRRAAESHLRLHVWQKKEIENYLFVPQSLARIAGIAKDGEAYQAFCEELFQKIDELKEDTRGKILDQLHTNDKSKAPSVHLAIANERLNRSWGSLEGRLSVSGGKEAISLINQWMRDRYKRSCSRAKMIDSLTVDDIPEEMKNVIDELMH